MMSSEPIYAIFGIILAENQKLEIRHYFVHLSIHFGKEKYFESRKILFVFYVRHQTTIFGVLKIYSAVFVYTLSAVISLKMNF